MPKISVIIPIYGVEKYIARCADSLFKQTLTDIEFIFINDCTKDDSMIVLNKVIEENYHKFTQNKWTVIVDSMPKNSGLPSVRKYGISLATGEYIAHCDSDDWVEPTMYQKLYDKAKENDYDIVWCGYYRTDGVSFHSKSDNRWGRLMQGPVWNKMVKRSLYIEHDISYPTANKAEDGALMTQLSFYAKSRQYIDEPLYYYFMNASSITGRVDEASCLRKLEQEKENVELRVAFLKREGIDKEYDFDIVMWKYVARENLKPLLKIKKYKRMWRKTYPEINKIFIWDRRIHFRTKLAFLLRYLGLV